MHPSIALGATVLPDLEGWTVDREYPGSVPTEGGDVAFKDIGELIDLDDVDSFSLAASGALTVVVVVAHAGGDGNRSTLTIGVLIGDDSGPDDWRKILDSDGRDRRLSIDTGCLAILAGEDVGRLQRLEGDPANAERLWSRVTSWTDHASEVIDGVCFVAAETNTYSYWGKYGADGTLRSIYLDLYAE
ncbi:hypothetical protein [Nocardioides luteus]|uniref:hypothetical protein n=1 Tax=Nocardioides luteus TaxID=1844 RepID=UPI00115FB63D|nr:hypothetical protein [Nocardioides luteus]